MLNLYGICGFGHPLFGYGFLTAALGVLGIVPAPRLQRPGTRGGGIRHGHPETEGSGSLL